MTDQALLSIENLHASIAGQEILQGFDLQIRPGEIHAIMGPNGSGKSTLSQILAGNENYEITSGKLIFQGQDLTEMEIEERAQAGLFLGFQYPVEIPGVSGSVFLRMAVNAMRKARGQEELDAISFVKWIKDIMRDLQIPHDMLKRPVNSGFSGGEKKRNEILQLAALEPKLAILDEIDSGLDIDALQLVAQAVNQLRQSERSFLLITHYQRLLDYITPDYVHIMARGRIMRSGGSELGRELEQKGYRGLIGEDAA